MNATFEAKTISLPLRQQSESRWSRMRENHFYGRDYSAEHILFLQEKARMIREKCQSFLLLGVGGSNGAARAIIEGLKPSGGPQIIYAANGLPPRPMSGFCAR